MKSSHSSEQDNPAPLPHGELVERQLPETTGISYYAFRPELLNERQPPLVFVHGYSRRAREHALSLLPLCEQMGCSLLAPLFPQDSHARYQQLRRGHDGQRSDRALDACIEDMFGADTGPFNLVGFSGGAQFAHRYMMAHPQRVNRLIAIAAGWYTLPDAALRYPQGLHTGRVRGFSMNPEKFLQVPTTVIVGDRDTGKQNLRCSEELNSRQGCTRVERARNWVAHMRIAAAHHRLPSLAGYLEIPGIGHDFEEFITRGHLLPLISDALSASVGTLRPSADPSARSQRAQVPATAQRAQRDCA